MNVPHFESINLLKTTNCYLKEIFLFGSQWESQFIRATVAFCGVVQAQ